MNFCAVATLVLAGSGAESMAGGIGVALGQGGGQLGEVGSGRRVVDLFDPDAELCAQRLEKHVEHLMCLGQIGIGESQRCLAGGLELLHEAHQER